jgi:methyl-accepting chemotaxis protein
MLPCLVLIIFMLGSSSRYMLKEIHLILNAFNRLAEGELNQQLEVKSRDEIGQLCYFFNSMTDKLKNVIEGTILSMDELSHSIENVAASTGDASRSANEVADVSINTGTSVSETADAMKKIFNSVNESAEIVNALGEKSNEIGEVTRVIDEIADQTNLLALNAAIEAARAGDQGRGFAVVADEVRKLAENTTKATKQIESYIRGIQEDTTTAVKIIKSGTAEVHTGLELSEHAGKSIEQAVGTIANISMLIEQIAAAAEEQSVTARELTLTIDAAFHTKKEKNANPGYQTHAAHFDTAGKYRAG